MAELQTRPTGGNVEAFLEGVTDTRRREDARKVMELMRETTGAKPVMWGPAIIGFGSQHYTYASGREGTTMAIGLSPRKQYLTLYGLVYYDRNRDLAKRLGPHTEGKGCVYIKKLDDIDLKALERLIKVSFDENND